jgi:hypothetical protein
MSYRPSLAFSTSLMLLASLSLFMWLAITLVSRVQEWGIERNYERVWGPYTPPRSLGPDVSHCFDGDPSSDSWACVTYKEGSS